MPAAATHREWAKRNKELFDYIGGAASHWSDWSMTLLFYAAVHEVSAFLVDNAATVQAAGLALPSNHAERKAVLRKCWPQLATYYEPLEQRSWGARYKCRRFGENEIKIGEKLLEGLRKEIAKLKP